MDGLLIFENFASELREWGSWLLGGLNSNFPAALAGAAAGTLGAHWITTWAKRRDETIREIHETNAAIVLCGSICRSFLVHKQQHVRRLVENYHNLKREFEAHVDARKTDRTKTWSFGADLETMPELVIPLEQFEKIAYAELSLDAATLGLVPVLSQVIFSFNEVVKKRNTFVGLYKGGQSPDFVPLYFGAPMAQGQDTTYPALIAGIGQYTDDGIWFSRRLVELLQKHGLELRKRGRKLPKVAKTNFENAEAAGLFPPDEGYGAWLAHTETGART